jgi:hypothetical protein
MLQAQHIWRADIGHRLTLTSPTALLLSYSVLSCYVCSLLPHCSLAPLRSCSVALVMHFKPNTSSYHDLATLLYHARSLFHHRRHKSRAQVC